MNIHNTTYNYYSKFSCVDLLKINNNELIFIESNLRDEVLKGFVCKFSSYALISKDKVVIA